LLVLLPALLLLSVLEEEELGFLKTPVVPVASGGRSIMSGGRTGAGVGAGSEEEEEDEEEAEEEDPHAGWLVAHSVSWSRPVREGLAAAMV